MQFGDSWTEDQAAVADVLMIAWAEHQVWPIFQYVAGELAKRGIADAAAVLHSFPTLGDPGTTTTRAYCDVGYEHTYPAPSAGSQVWLSVSGLAQHHAGEEIALGFVGVLRHAAKKYAQTPMSATKVVEVDVSRQELVELPSQWWPASVLRAVGDLLQREWPAGVQFLGGPLGDWTIRVNQDVLRYADATVDSYIEQIKEDIEASALASSLLLHAPDGGSNSGGSSVSDSLPYGLDPGGEVFLVHGRDAEAKHHVARVVQQLTNKSPVILEEQPSRSRTVIEKFEDHGGRAAFAIVLLTADDEGGPAGGAVNPRARQNVVFELGYFVGLLGRERVVALTKGGVELPSDIAGVVYISLDKDDWPQRLGREMRELPGLDADLNRL